MGNEREIENFKRSMYPWEILHKFGLNGKIGGSITVVGEMHHAIAVIHGPKGCCFFYRLSAHRRYPYYDLESSDMEREEVLFGGAAQLENRIREIYMAEKPELIFIIHSPVSDVLHEDIEGVALRLKREGIPAVDVKSGCFSHREKDFGSRRMAELAESPAEKRENVVVDFKGCGLTEAMNTLVDEVMVSCPRKSKTFNLEVLLMKGEVYQALPEMLAFLKKFGIQLNCMIPNDPLEKLREAPAADLNIVSRMNWANHMKDCFGTDYLHYRSANRYYGWKGVCLLYRDIFQKMHMDESAFAKLDKMENEYLDQIAEERAFLSQCRVHIMCRDVKTAVQAIHLYAGDFQMNVGRLYLFLTEEDYIEQEIASDVETKIFERIRKTAEIYGVQMKLCRTLDDITDDPDFMTAEVLVNTNDFRFERLGLPVIPSVLLDVSMSYESFLRAARKLVDWMKGKRLHNMLWLNKLGTKEFEYPLYQDEMTLLSRKLWNEMWYE